MGTKVITKAYLDANRKKFLGFIRQGAVFIYPTDTIYGVGCSAYDEQAIGRIRTLKQRKTQPFSLIAPSKAWIEENCVLTTLAEEWLTKLPGAYTLILQANKATKVASNLNPELDTFGVRIPDHWIAHFVTELGIPIVTTSANIHGEDYMTSLETLNNEIFDGVDFIIYDGERQGKPSSVIDLSGDEIIHKR